LASPSLLADSCVSNAEQKKSSLVYLTKGRKIFLSVMMIFYYIVAGFWNSPGGPLRDLAFKYLRIPTDLFAFEQTWNMFGPPLRLWNGHYFATITFADGSSRICEFPRMEKMNLWEKFKREKLRKLFIDNLPNPDFRSYMPFMCATIALANANPVNQPVLVCLTFKWGNLPELDENKYAPPYQYAEHIYSRTDCVYRVKPEDLQ
jgi:hypothetical protein